MKVSRSLSTLAIAAAFIGTVVGAGFATGQEVLQFFAYYGLKGLGAILAATLLFCYFGVLIMKMSRSLRAESHMELVTYTTGPQFGRLLDMFITVSFFGVLMVMLAGAGAVAQEQLALPPLYGSLAVMALSFLTVVSGVNNVIRAIGFVVPFLLLSVLGVAVFSILQHPLAQQDFLMMDALTPPITKFWPLSSLLYVSYNTFLAIAILAPMGVHARNDRSLLWGGVLGGVGLGLGILAIFLAILSAVPEILTFQVPMLYLTSGMHPFFAYGYGLILFLEIYTTSVSVLYGFVARISYHNNLKRFFWALLASAGAMLGAQLGFSKMVATIYPIMGLAGLFFLFSLLWISLRELTFGRKFPRKRR